MKLFNLKNAADRASIALFATLMSAPLVANAQTFDNLCNVYNQFFGANSKLIGFGLSIMTIVALVAYFTSEEKRGIISVVASIIIIAAVVFTFPQILGAMGVATC